MTTIRERLEAIMNSPHAPSYSVRDGNRIKVVRSGHVRQPEPKGYARTPGTGPAGETCRSCRNFTRVDGGAREFLKCGLTAAKWTRGRRTDILAGSPACALWVPELEGDLS